ncbi:MAG: selenocysteine-specific translation elongation factor [Halanaerobium sp.]
MNEKNIIIGTAGHIDHGKTTLIKALTGHDTDRLDQEKERGISIELGFTDLELDNGTVLGIIDVPGHEHFVKNMLAGAAGVDLALLVVAADEGMMPQSDEHLSILDILGVEHGIVVITKTDKVEAEWLELVKEDTREKLKGTFLENAAVVEVSAVEEKGIDKLISQIEAVIDDIPPKNKEANVFYPIDRVFTLKGHGTIVTGTLFKGSITVEDELEIYPEEEKVRVRSLQVHNRQVEKAKAGQRVGINLANIEKREISRGDVLASPESLIKTKFFEGHLHLLKDLKMVVNHADRIRMHIGAQEVLGRIYFFDREQLLPGEDAYVQFRLENEMVAHFKERFVIRRYSPMQTIGGGRILEIDPPPRRKNEIDVISELKRLENASDAERTALFIKHQNKSAAQKKDIAKRTGLSENNLDTVLEMLSNKEIIIKLSSGNESSWIHQETFNNLKEEILQKLNDYHQKHHLEKGIKKGELRTQLGFRLNKRELDRVIEIMLQENLVKENDNRISLVDFKVILNDKEKEIREKIIKEYKKNLFAPASSSEITAQFENIEKAEAVFNYLLSEGEIIRLKEDIYLYKTALEKAKEKLKKYFEENETIELAEFRDLLNSTRKYALPILEKFDRDKITSRDGDKRKLR